MAARRRRRREGAPLEAIESEISLTLSLIEKTRSLREEVNLDLLQTEAYVDTELKRMEDRTPVYSPYRYPEREKFQRRLFEIGQERRRHNLHLEERISQLQDRLSNLLNQFDMLKVYDGN